MKGIYSPRAVVSSGLATVSDLEPLASNMEMSARTTWTLGSSRVDAAADAGAAELQAGRVQRAAKSRSVMLGAG
jgi:hypothetical protein